MISVDGLVKRFGSKVAVAGLSFQVEPGQVTGFLGPNGSGKSTTMRCMLGLDRPDAGEARFGGQRYHDIADPLRSVGVLLDAGYVHPGRSARNHLRWIAASNGLPAKRTDEVLDLVGLTSVGRDRVRSYSLGMKQRLGLATALLGDPHTVVLDEPANGLDPEGIRWIRDILTYIAGQGKTVLVSSHLLSEMSLMATALIVIGQGRLIDQCSVQEFVDKWGDRWVRVQSPTIAPITSGLRAGGAQVTDLDGTTISVRGATTAQVGELAARNGVVLHELSTQTGSLEDAFLRATASFQEYQTHIPGAVAAAVTDAGTMPPDTVPPGPVPPPMGGPFASPGATGGAA